MTSKRMKPADHEAIRVLVAQGLSSPQVAEKVGWSPSSICLAVQRHNLGPWKCRGGRKSGGPMEVPADFEELWPTMSRDKLARHYKRSENIITAWTKERGLSRPRGITLAYLASVGNPKEPRAPKPRKSRAKPKVPGKTPWTTSGGHRAQEIMVQRDMSPVGLAVEYLRMFSAVYRCNAEGRPDPIAGKFWLRGHTVLTDADIIERADWLRSRETQRRVA